MKSLYAMGCAGLIAAASLTAWAQGEGPGSRPAVNPAAVSRYAQAAPLDALLSDWPYPYPVRRFAVRIGGTRAEMAYMDVAPATSPRGVVVLMHGKNFASEYWGGVIAALTGAGYRVIAPDQIGFGKSDKPDLPYHFDEFAANTAALLDSLGVGRFTLVANSMGGMLAVRFARLYPQRLNALVLEDPLGLENYTTAIPPQTDETLLRLEMAQTEESYRRFLHGYFPNWRPEFERYAEMFVRLQRSPDYPRWARASVLSYQMIHEQPIVDDLPKLAMPTLLIIGQLDRTVFGRRFVDPQRIKGMGDFPSLGRAAQRTIPQARLVEFENVGHVPHLEIPERFARTLLDFLAER